MERAAEKIRHYLSQLLQPEPEIAVLLSGGVDSSVALASLLRCGYRRISAYYLKVWLGQHDRHDLAGLAGLCPWEQDLDYASAVCEQLDLPLHIVPLQDEYYQYVVEYMLAELRSARTPSPDLFCNQYVKFGAFVRHLQKQEAPLIASGHYARLLPLSKQTEQEATTGPKMLLQAVDPIKDQSYFLSRLQQAQLQNLLFPLGCLHKAEVRSLAEAWKLPTARRRDSQGICFLGKVKFGDFARHYLGENPGAIVDLDRQQALGQHRGLWFHTIGQRQGLGLGGGPWYVWAKEQSSNTLYVRHAHRLPLDSPAHSGQLVKRFAVDSVSWLTEEAPFAKLKAQFPQYSLLLKLRHGPAKIPAQLHPTSQAGRWQVEMEYGDRGVAPGQFAVFYWGDICLGSGAICDTSFKPAPLLQHQTALG